MQSQIQTKDALTKNVSYVDVGLVQTCSDLIESYGWWWGGLSKNLVKPWA